MTASSTSTSTRALLQLFAVDHPLVQAPMAGVSTAAMAAAVANAGALESIGVGATDASGARAMIADFRQRSARSLNVNVFCHAPARADAKREAAWLDRLRPEYSRVGARPGYFAHPHVMRRAGRRGVESQPTTRDQPSPEGQRTRGAPPKAKADGGPNPGGATDYFASAATAVAFIAPA